ncbi:MAG: hypothetical protein RIB65_09945 [Ilumatobacter fluminis]|uniref:hypothetical protein n=1 Tax=Ilumatobacter fluminis TaxID=467091 RepID=UPI0032EAD66A
MKQNTGNEFRPLKRLLGAAAIGIGVVALTTPGTGSSTRELPVVGVRPRHEQLQIDTYMIEQMSTPNANTGRQNHRSVEQLRRSQDPGYLAALEQHQVDIDLMLARR